MNIIGKSECTASQMAQYLIERNSNAKSWALEYAKLYLEEGEVEGVRGDGAWIQSCKETGNFKFTGGTAVTFDQNNFCGLGVTKKGMKGHSFDTPRLGIRAQIQHLKGYATSTPLKNPCIDPRYKYITKGISPRFEDLAGKWAVPGYDTTKASSLQDAMNKGIGYGFDIIAGINTMKKININNIGGNTMKYKVAVDAGHGSNTAGKRTPDGYREHWTNVKCANYFDIAMKRCGFDTIKTAWNDTNATDDADVALSARQSQIKNARCDISVSWHANAFGDGKSYNSSQGIETLIHSDSAKAKDSKELATKVQNYLIKGTKQKNRGVKSANLAMCNCVSMGTKASILIETGFMTNEYESQLIQSDAFCLECAEEVAQGVCEYFGVVYIKPNGSTVSSKPSIPTNSQTISSSEKTYTVKKGDTLSNIGIKTGVDWKTIANLNGIKSPYTIKVGQVLKLAAESSNNSSSYNNSKKYMSNGVDYSPVFDPIYYSNKYVDLKKAFGTDANKLFSHFVKYGMKEGRQAISTFNVTTYKNRYADLQKAFGNNLPAYYKHFCQFGKKEGRSAV